MAIPELPEDIKESFNNKAHQYTTYMQKEDYDNALSCVQAFYDELLAAQSNYKTRFHKGYPLHNIGYTKFSQKKPHEALPFFILAYIEDLISEDDENTADMTPAGVTLIKGYGLNSAVVDQLKKQVRELKKEGKIPWDPYKVARGLSSPWNSIVLESLSKLKKTSDKVETLEARLQLGATQELAIKTEPPEVLLQRKIYGEFESDWNKRIFVGGSGSLGATFNAMKKAVIKLGYQAVIANEFETPQGMSIYNKCLSLLHGCKYAIFDVTQQAGQLFELDRAVDYGVKTLLIWQKGSGGNITSMLTECLNYRGFESYEYDDIEILQKVFKDFLDRNKGPQTNKQIPPPK